MKKKNQKILIGTLIGAFAFSISTTFAVIMKPLNTITVNSKQPSFKSFASVNLLQKKSKTLVSTQTFKSYFIAQNNKITSYSHNGIEEFSIPLSNRVNALAISTFQIAQNDYLAAITSDSKFLIFDLNNPTIIKKSFNIHENLNTISKTENYLYLYSDQNPLNNSSFYTKLNLKTLELEKMPIAAANESSASFRFLSNIVHLVPNVNLLVTLTINGHSSNNVNNSTTFKGINYSLVDDQLQPLPESSVATLPFSSHSFDFNTPLKYEEINTNSKTNTRDLKFDTSIAAFVSLGTKVLVIQKSLNMQLIDVPRGKIIDSIIFNNSTPKVIFKDEKFVYNLNPKTGQFWVNQNLPTIKDQTPNATFNLVDINNNDAFIVVVHDSGKTFFYGLSPTRHILLNDSIYYEIRHRSLGYVINSEKKIPLLSSNLKLENLVIVNRNGKPYVAAGNIDFLKLSTNPEDNFSSATIKFDLASTSWYDDSKTTVTTQILEIKNMIGTQEIASKSWIEQIVFNNSLNVSIEQLTPNYLKTVIKPLNISFLDQDPLQILSIDYFLQNISNNRNTLTLSAFIRYINKVDNSVHSLKLDKDYLINLTNEKIFEIVGNVDNDVININTVIRESNGKINSSIKDFLPSYIFRSSSDNLNPTVQDLESFYLRFVKKINNVKVSIIADADDKAGTLRLTFNLDQSISKQDGTSFSTRTITYTGFKKTENFFVTFINSKKNDDKVDFQKIVSLTPNQKNISPFTLLTGANVRSLLYGDKYIYFEDNIEQTSEIEKKLLLLLQTNLDLMKFKPIFEILNKNSQEELLKSIKEGTLDLQVKYPYITSELAKSLGLDENLSKRVHFYNLPKIKDLFTLKIDSKQANEIIDNNESGVELTEEFQNRVLNAIEIAGFTESDISYEMKWVGDSLMIKAKTKENNLQKSNILPKTFDLEISWANKNYPVFLRTVLGISIPTIFIVVFSIGTTVLVLRRKRHMRKYF